MSPDRKLKILILGLNYAPELVGIAVYTAGLAETLASRGHAVEVIAGKPYYPAWSVDPAYRGGWRRRQQEAGVDVTRAALYVPATPSGGRRILHHLSFGASVLLPTLMRAVTTRPDVILTVAPSLIAAPVARMAAALCGARSWLHVQDFEVEAAMATGLVSDAGTAARMATRFESFVLGRFDRVSSISPAMCRKLAEKQVAPDRIIEFRNWADIAGIQPLMAPSPYRQDWGISTPHVALYSGNIANKQGIEIILGAARRLQDRTDLTFVISGQGPNRANLEALAEGLPNILFRDLQPKERLGDLLGLASVHLLPQLASTADLVLPSKLTNMLASGRPVVATAHPGTGLADEVAGCGCVVEPENEEAFAAAIAWLLDHPAEARDFGSAARQRAEERWNRDAIISRVEEQLLTLCGREVPDA